MIHKWAVKNPLTIEERRLIKEGIDLDLSYNGISKYVGRSKTTICRETKRINNNYKEYDPELAQKDFENKQKLVGIPKNKR